MSNYSYTELSKIYDDYVEEVSNVGEMVEFFSLFTSNPAVFEPLLEALDDLEMKIRNQLGLSGDDELPVKKPVLTIISNNSDMGSGGEQLELDM